MLLENVLNSYFSDISIYLQKKESGSELLELSLKMLKTNVFSKKLEDGSGLKNSRYVRTRTQGVSSADTNYQLTIFNSQVLFIIKIWYVYCRRFKEKPIREVQNERSHC